MIWEPFVLALFLGLVVSAGLYFAYLWPSVEPEIEPALASADSRDKPDSVIESASKTESTSAKSEVAVAPPKLPDSVPEKTKGPPMRPSDGDLTPLPPPQPEDDGVSDLEKGS
ncbi:MAG: hypothetical protein ACKV2T_18600 [Kofleriaceae bacterium]